MVQSTGGPGARSDADQTQGLAGSTAGLSVGTPDRGQLAMIKLLLLLALLVMHVPAVTIAGSILSCRSGMAACAFTDDGTTIGPQAATTAGTVLFHTSRAVYFGLSIIEKDYTAFSSALGVTSGFFVLLTGFLISQNITLVRSRGARYALVVLLTAGFVVSLTAEYLLTSGENLDGLGFTALGYIKDRFGSTEITLEMIRASLTGYLQFLRLCDALILGASLGIIRKGET